MVIPVEVKTMRRPPPRVSVDLNANPEDSFQRLGKTPDGTVQFIDIIENECRAFPEFTSESGGIDARNRRTAPAAIRLKGYVSLLRNRLSFTSEAQTRRL